MTGVGKANGLRVITGFPVLTRGAEAFRSGELPVSRIPCLPQPQSDLGDASTQFRGTFQSKSIAVQLILETARHDIGPRV